MKNFDCDKAFIKELFDENHWYCIPNYQRPYVWETDNVETLLENLKNAFENKEDSYFLGSIVYKKNQKSSEGLQFTELELLDGQQRLTTLFLIFAVIRDVVLANKEVFDNDEFDELLQTCTESIYQKKSKLKNIPERLKIVFDIRNDVKEFVDSHIKEVGSITSKNDFEILANSKDCNTSIKHMANTVIIAKNFFKENISQVADFLQYVLNNVIIVYISTEDLQDAFQLFTVINNTGIKLSNSDILKAENLREVTDEKEQRKFAESWEEMESYFGEDFDNFLSQVRTILVKRKADFNLIKEFDDNIYSEKSWNKNSKQWESCKPLLKKGEETFSLLKEYFSVYQSIFDNNHFTETKSYAIANYLTLFQTGFETDYWKAPVLLYFKKFGYKNFFEFLKRLDNKISCDWVIGVTQSSRIENVCKILEQIDSFNATDEIIKSEVFDCKTDDFKQIISGNVYGRKYARYLLLKIDTLLHGDTTPYNLPSSISIEHILPQTPDENSQWTKDFSFDEREEMTDKLGNLVLISGRKNSSQRNYPYNDKKEKYFKKKVETFAGMIKVFIENDEWKPENFRKRQNEIVSMLLENFD